MENKQISIHELHQSFTKDLDKDQQIANLQAELVNTRRLAAQAIEVLSADIKKLKAQEPAQAEVIDAD